MLNSSRRDRDEVESGRMPGKRHHPSVWDRLYQVPASQRPSMFKQDPLQNETNEHRDPAPATVTAYISPNKEPDTGDDSSLEEGEIGTPEPKRRRLMNSHVSNESSFKVRKGRTSSRECSQKEPPQLISEDAAQNHEYDRRRIIWDESNEANTSLDMSTRKDSRGRTFKSKHLPDSQYLRKSKEENNVLSNGGSYSTNRKQRLYTDKTHTSSTRSGRERKRTIPESHQMQSWAEEINKRSSVGHTNQISRKRSKPKERSNYKDTIPVLCNDNTQASSARRGRERKRTIPESHQMQSWAEEIELKTDSVVGQNKMAMQKDLDIVSSHRISNQSRFHDKPTSDNVNERATRERDRKHHNRTSSDSRACDSYRRDYRDTVRDEKRPLQEEYGSQHQTSHGNGPLQLDETNKRSSAGHTNQISRKRSKPKERSNSTDTIPVLCNDKTRASSARRGRERKRMIPESHQRISNQSYFHDKPTSDNVNKRATHERDRKHHTRTSSDSRACDSYRRDYRDTVRDEKCPLQEEYGSQHQTSHGNGPLQLDETNKRSSAGHTSQIWQRPHNYTVVHDSTEQTFPIAYSRLDPTLQTRYPKRRQLDATKRSKANSMDFKPHMPRKNTFKKKTHNSGLLGTISYLSRPEHQPNHIATTLANRGEELDAYLLDVDDCPQIVKLASVLSKCCRAMLCKSNKTHVMYILRRRNFFERKDIIGELKENSLSSSLGNDMQFVMDLVSIMNTMIQTVSIPQADTMIATSLLKGIIEQKSGSNDEFSVSLKDAFAKIGHAYSKEEYSVATENFALTLPILPDIDAIRSEDPVCVPVHSIHTPFTDDQHYVSYMYTIFREDFIRPLTKGIKSYITHLDRCVPDRFRSNDVRFYDDVYVVSPNAQIENGIVWTIQFKRRRGSSTMHYGSLLCLSSDGFASIHFATVVNRDIQLLKKGQIDIKFVDTVDTTDIIGRRYVMLESKAFFEAYYHVLLSMKQLAEKLESGESTLPMGKYLIGQTNTVEPSAATVYSLECLKQYGDTTLKPSGSSFVVDVKNTTDWPSSSEVGLDVSQYKALKSCLRQELSLIQGPPGTGKTMMGVRLAEVFISNFHLFPLHERTPLLLVSYTNHALDQFLQLILRTSTMANILPWDIVRVGSGCKNEEIDRFSLKRHRKMNSCSDYRRSYYHVKDLSRNISMIKDILSAYQQNLIHEDSLHETKVMSWMHYNQLVDRRYDNLPYFGTFLWLWLNLNLNSALSRETTMEEDNQWFEVDYTTMDRDGWVDDIMDDDEDIHQVACDELKLPKRALDEDIVKDQYQETRRNISRRLSVKHHFINGVQASGIYDIWQLNIEERWALYRYWIHEITQPLELKLHELEGRFEATSCMYREARSLLDCRIMKKASVVAMTTTAASRFRDILKEVAPSTLIIEEASQVSEQHILAALSTSCQRLIMIGDHQQLRPACNDYELSKSHSTDVSLFERLIMCKFPFHQLENQHRMRPEISTLLVPHIYPHLNDDESVFHYPDVRGMASNVYFWTHNVPEDRDDSLSYSNKHEAELLSKLYRHLRLQGYQGKDITVLALYSDQIKLLHEKMLSIERTDPFIRNQKDSNVDSADEKVVQKANRCDVHITTVDNFQGEENRIILLSLVRSTKGKRIGHLAVGNRICVSLSRAREGLFVVGNMTCLRHASPLWDKIISKAERNGICGEHLELKCLKHPTHRKKVKMANDFDAVEDGGCEQPCNFRLACGHTCSRKCHSDDPDHQLPCTKICTIVCEHGHSYQMPCNEGKGECMEDVDAELKCGHRTKAKCSTDVSSVQCKERCTEKVSCGHTCQKRCSEVCTTEQDCNELVKVTGNCQHTYQIACCKKMYEQCSVKCDAILECGHPCVGKCGLCHQGRLHMPCRKKCKRVLVCGHDCNAYCIDVCPPCMKPCAVKCKHSVCGGKCAAKCIPCKETCQWACRRTCKNKYRCTKLCSEDCNRPRCNIPCRRRMPCGHKCIGLQCEECFCKECSDETEFEIFFGSEDDPGAVFYKMPDCRHIFEVTSLDKYLDSASVGSVGKITCPKCKTPLTGLHRYGNIIRQCFRDIDTIKSKLYSNDLETKKTRNELLNKAKMIVTDCEKKEFIANIESARNNMAQLLSLGIQMTFFYNIVKTIKNVDVLLPEQYISQDNGQRLKMELGKLKQWTLNKRFKFSDQEIDEFQLELTRVRFCCRMMVVQGTLQKKEIVPDEDKQKVNEVLARLSNGSKLLKEEEDPLECMLKDLEMRHPSSGLGITDDERIMIVKAMGFSQKGHWNKCKNGHIYAIGECGGAMQEAKCPECSQDIGGSHHKLKEDNSLASEMDGAQYSAWSEMANMNNFDLND